MIIQYLRLAWIFIKIGVFTIGGGYAMLPLINSELISNGLMSATEVADMIALAQMTPGPFAINAATFSGVRTLGLFGGIIPSIAVTVPSLIITTLLAKYFFKFSDNIIVRRAMWGLRPAVTGLIAAAAVIMAVPSLFGCRHAFRHELFRHCKKPRPCIAYDSNSRRSNNDKIQGFTDLGRSCLRSNRPCCVWSSWYIKSRPLL